MYVVLIGLAIATFAGIAVHLLRRGRRGGMDVDAGSVSEGWLSEQRGRKDDP